MKRWVVFGLVALAVVVLVSPGIVGKLAEQNLRSSITWAGHENEGLVVTEERFERGWFTAAGRHRVELDGGIFDQAAGPGEIPALVIDTRIDHGLVPVTSMARDAGSLAPALASTLSTLSLDLGEGRIVELPGRLTSRIGLTGATDSHYQLDAGSLDDDGVALEWRGADIRFAIDASAAELDYRGRVEPVAWTRDGQASSLGVTEFEGDQQKTPFGFSTGRIMLRMSDASLVSPVGGVSGFRTLAFEARNSLEEQRVHGNSSIDVAGLVVPALGPVDFGLDVAVTGLDAATLQSIREAIDDARKAGGLDEALNGVYPTIEDDLQSLLMAGGTIAIDRFVLALPQGEVHAALHIEVPESGAPEFSWPSLLLAVKASADVRVPSALVDMAGQANPEQARSLVAMGVLKRDGDDYVIEAEYAQGLVTVNGAPMPLPLGLFSGSGPRSATD